MITYAKEKKMGKIGWHCLESNIGSYKLAEKVDFKMQCKYNYYHGWYNAFDNNLVNGNYYLNQGKTYEKGAMFYEKAFSMFDEKQEDALSSEIFSNKSVRKWIYYNAAYCWALSNQVDQAFANLNKAMNAGWSNFKMLKEDERLLNLYNDKRWKVILDHEK